MCILVHLYTRSRQQIILLLRSLRTFCTAHTIVAASMAGKQATPVGIGPYGGTFGTPNYIDNLTSDPPTSLTKILVWSSANAPGAHINGIYFSYMTASGKPQEKTWGTKGVENTVPVSENQGSYLVKVMGRHDNNSVKSLTFITSDGTPHGPYGDITAAAAGNMVDFQIPVLQGSIVGFFATTGQVLNALGAYVIP